MVERLFPCSPQMVCGERPHPQPGKIRSDWHRRQISTRGCDRCGNLGWRSYRCVQYSQEPGHHARWYSLIRSSRWQCVQSRPLPHHGSTPHTEVRRCWNCPKSRLLNGWSTNWLLQLNTVYGTSAANLNKLQRVINTLARGCLEPGSAITSHRFWLICIGSQSPPVSNSRSLFRHSRHWQQINLADLLNCQTTSRSLRSSSRMRLHVDVARTVFASRAFCHAAPSIWKYGTLYLFIWLTFPHRWILSKNNSKHTCIIYHTFADSPPRPRLRFNSFIFDNMFSLTYGASPAVYYYIIIITYNDK